AASAPPSELLPVRHRTAALKDAVPRAVGDPAAIVVDGLVLGHDALLRAVDDHAPVPGDVGFRRLRFALSSSSRLRRVPGTSGSSARAPAMCSPACCMSGHRIVTAVPIPSATLAAVAAAAATLTRHRPLRATPRRLGAPRPRVEARERPRPPGLRAASPRRRAAG